MNLNDQALDDNTTKAVPYEHKGVFLAQLPLKTVDQDQTSTKLNKHIIAMCGILSTINMLRSMLTTNLVHPTSSSTCLLYVQVHNTCNLHTNTLKRTIYNGIYMLDLNSSPLPQRHASKNDNIFESPIFLVPSL
jgi:riboflavin synthase alpha subunit